MKTDGFHTFTFRISTLRPGKNNNAWADRATLVLPGKVVNFRCSTKHEAIYVDGGRHGGRDGQLLEAVHLDDDDRIDSLTIGLSTSSLNASWGGGMVANVHAPPRRA
eukprot:5873557-Prymnesium_polylepis.1